MGLNNGGGQGSISIADLLGQGANDQAGTNPITGQTPSGDLTINQSSNPNGQAGQYSNPSFLQQLSRALSGGAGSQTPGPLGQILQGALKGGQGAMQSAQGMRPGMPGGTNGTGSLSNQYPPQEQPMNQGGSGSMQQLIQQILSQGRVQ